MLTTRSKHETRVAFAKAGNSRANLLWIMHCLDKVLPFGHLISNSGCCTMTEFVDKFEYNGFGF